ncbi:MAG TPA: dTDP-4-dehydrorhamnose reductase [Solirubrobacterales bacterium]|nr:dTDP-4-dehydrorhamnose reductase [Solirubrobacterales bacterium]
MRVLVAGGDGMLAHEVIDAARRAGHEVSAFGRKKLDITDPRSIDDVVGGAAPEAVVNCAAWSDVDGAEDDERGAMRVNDEGAALLAAAAERVGAKIVYPSSDYVFDGSKRAPYVESDLPGPIGAYGRSKLGGETSVAVANPRHFIVRSSWLYGHSGKNFVETMLQIGLDQPEVLVVADQRGCPTSCVDLAKALIELIEDEEYGIHHIAAAGDCTWFDFAAEIFDQADYETRVMSTTSDVMARKAPRPAYSVLRSERSDPIELPPWQDSLRRYLADRELEGT